VTQSELEPEQKERKLPSLREIEQIVPFAWVVVFASAPLGVFEFVLPLFGTALGASATTVGWLFSVFSFTALVLRPIVGYIIDLGRRDERPWWLPSSVGLLVFGLSVYALSMALFALADSVEFLVIARLVQGVGSSITWLTINVVLADQSAPAQRARAYGWLTSLGVVGNGLGAIWTVIIVGLFDAPTRAQVTSFLPILTQYTGLPFEQWRFPTPELDSVTTLHIVFWGYVAAMLFALFLAKRSSYQRPTAPVAAQGRLSPLDPLFLPLLPLFAVAFLRAVGYALTLPVLTIYLNDRFQAGLVGVGFAFALPGIIYAFAPGPLGKLADRMGHQRAAVIGILASTLTCVFLPLLPQFWMLIPLWVFEAFCFCLTGPAISALIADTAEERLRGQAFAHYALIGGIGSAFAPTVGGWMYEAWGAAWPFWINGVVVALAALVLLRPLRKASQSASTNLA
jgi:MFS family permease